MCLSVRGPVIRPSFSPLCPLASRVLLLQARVDVDSSRVLFVRDAAHHACIHIMIVSDFFVFGLYVRAVEVFQLAFLRRRRGGQEDLRWEPFVEGVIRRSPFSLSAMGTGLRLLLTPSTDTQPETFL